MLSLSSELLVCHKNNILESRNEPITEVRVQLSFAILSSVSDVVNY